MKLLKQAWSKWKAFGRIVADFQGRALLTLFYFVILLIPGLIFARIMDSLKLKKNASVGWESWNLHSDTLEQVSNQD